MKAKSTKVYISERKWWRLSNFAAVSFGGWPTLEHAYQAAKFVMGSGEARTPDEYKLKEAYHRMIKNAPDPGIAKDLAHIPKAVGVVRPDWEEAKVSIMKELLRAKVSDSGSTLMGSDLLATGDMEIVEDSSDDFWGCGPDGNGKNMLGKLWMEIREELRKE